jgi:hypothetical protein
MSSVSAGKKPNCAKGLQMEIAHDIVCFRFAVLVNELGTIDIDSSLLDSKKTNAGLGMNAS